MSGKDAGRFLHATYLFPLFPLLSSLFKKTAYGASSVARRFGCRVRPTICLGQEKRLLPFPGPAAAAGAGSAHPSPGCSRAGSIDESSLPPNPREGGLLSDGACLTPAAAESQQTRVVTGFDCSHVNQAGNSLWHLVSVYFVF